MGYGADTVVLVTGACGGIGSAVAKTYAEAGVSLGLCDIRSGELKSVADGLRERGARVCEEMTDVADEGSVRGLAERMISEFGHVDHLVNTVGVVDVAGDVLELSLEEWNRALAVNLTSAFLVAKHVVPLIIASGGGSIVNISSISGFANQAAAMAYSVTKAGLNSLTRSEAIDLARHNVRANAICPGSVNTSLVEEAARLTAKVSGRTAVDTREAWEQQYPTGRFTEPDEIAELALFLTSSKAANITGSTYIIDGGLTALLPER